MARLGLEQKQALEQVIPDFKLVQCLDEKIQSEENPVCEDLDGSH